MAEYKLSNKAVEDLNQIWEYTFYKWSEKKADNYYNLLLASCQDIANNPNLGRNHKEINKDLFGFKSNKHIIFYRMTFNEYVEITRILHERMDLKNRLNE
ncbi:MAG: type II toxin-antitoxin system RelE/ParE family toxin [Bergeyella sp.]